MKENARNVEYSVIWSFISKSYRITTNIPHLLFLSHISPTASPCTIFVISTLSADTHRLRYELLSLSLSVPPLYLDLSFSFDYTPSLFSDLGRNWPANWLRVIDALAEYRTSLEPIIYCSALYNVIIAGSYSTLAFSPHFLWSCHCSPCHSHILVNQTSRLIDSRSHSVASISKSLLRSWKCISRLNRLSFTNLTTLMIVN